MKRYEYEKLNIRRCGTTDINEITLHHRPNAVDVITTAGPGAPFIDSIVCEN